MRVIVSVINFIRAQALRRILFDGIPLGRPLATFRSGAAIQFAQQKLAAHLC